jgi:hypothetical protein
MIREHEKTKMKMNQRLRTSLVACSLLFLTTAHFAFGDDLESLDDPAPTAEQADAAGGESLDTLDDSMAEISDAPDAGSGGDVAIDLGGGEPTFNPYIFSRDSAWGFLPIGALILVGLHLMRVPKRKSKRKIDQARRFFRGISGEGTNSSIMVTKTVEADEPKGGS